MANAQERHPIDGPGTTASFDLLAWSYCDAPKPDLPEVPMLLRRRAGTADRLALRAAFDCLAQQPLAPAATLFASRHGEVHRSIEILDALKAGEVPSPMAFSLSVHNASAGLYSMARLDKAPSSALSAGPESLGMALFEAAALLKTGCSPVLVVAYDEALPEAMKPFATDEDAPYALALMVGAVGGRPCTLTLRHGTSASESVTQGKRLAAALQSGQPTADLSLGTRRWSWGHRA